MGFCASILSSFRELVWVADRPPEVVLHPQGPPESRPLPGLRPAVHWGSRVLPDLSKTAAIVTHMMWQA